jgi:hypothetical protein
VAKTNWDAAAGLTTIDTEFVVLVPGALNLIVIVSATL